MLIGICYHIIYFCKNKNIDIQNQMLQALKLYSDFRLSKHSESKKTTMFQSKNKLEEMVEVEKFSKISLYLVV